MGMLFIPITTLSLSTLRGVEIGQGASFTGMMRQLGGSFGIALITTYMSRGNAIHRQDILAGANMEAMQQKINMTQAAFMAKGMPGNIALASAQKAMDFTISRQAAVLTYMDVFLYVGIMFLICVPFLLITKQRKQSAAATREALAAASH